MAYEGGPPRAMGLMRPGRALTGVLVALGAIWLMFAIAVNWAGASEEIFGLFCGSTERVLAGEVWRLFTAPLMHVPSGTISHILFALLGLFFFAPALEQRWGGPKLIRFLCFSSVFAYAFQMLVELALPASLASRLVGEYWFGSFPALEAVAIAWALNSRGQTAMLWFVLPVSARGMVIFIVAMSLLRIVAAAPGPEGLISPIGGMIAGWLIGGGTPSPLRRAYLKIRLAQLDREGARASRLAREKRQSSSLRVIEGGRGKGTPERDDHGSGGGMLH